MDGEDSKPQGQKKQNNVLPLWGNEKTMNLNSMVLTNILSSPYFKNELFKLKTYHEVVDEIYYKVEHLEPWEKGSRKTAGQVGMCGGVRGVGAGGIVSSAFCLLYKLFTLKLTRKQLNGLITHVDSPYIRALGFMFIRYCQPPAKLWDWMEPYLEDEEVSKTMSVILIPALCSVQLLNCQIIVFFKFLLLEINLQLGSLQYTTVIKMKNLKNLKHLDLSVRPKCNKSACLKTEMLQTVYIYCSLPVCICKEQVQN